MKLKIFEGEGNYTAVVTRLSNKNDLPGLDNLKGFHVFGNVVLVSKDEQIGTLGLFFPTECVLSHEFVSNNNLYRHSELNKDIEKKGYLEDSRRIRAVKFKGNISSGFWIPIDCLSYLDINLDNLNLNEGDEFNEIEGQEICRKYYAKQGQVAGQSNKIKTVSVSKYIDARCYPEHVDTSQLFKNFHHLKPSDLVSITTKVHGTSLRVGINIVYNKLSWFEKLLRKLGIRIKDHTYRYIVASRGTIRTIDFDDLDGKRCFYDSDVWTRAGMLFESKLHKGENIYAEIVGWDTNTPVQKGYTYGITKGAFEVYIYRISRTNPDGVTQDLTWPQLKARCQELGIKHVPEIFYGKVSEFVGDVPEGASWKYALETKIKSYLEKPSIFNCDSWKNVEEGIVLQQERLGTNFYLKAKSPSFLAHETALLDKGESDLESEETQALTV